MMGLYSGVQLFNTSCHLSWEIRSGWFLSSESAKKTLLSPLEESVPLPESEYSQMTEYEMDVFCCLRLLPNTLKLKAVGSSQAGSQEAARIPFWGL